MTNQERARLLNAFWHKSRKEYVCWTTEELTRRTGLDAGPLLNMLARKGFVNSVRGHDTKEYRATWDITGKGREVIEGVNA